MKSKFAVRAGLLLGLILVLAAGCASPTSSSSSYDASLIGSWGTGVVKQLSFVNSGVFTIYSGGAVLATYGYTASGGSGKYWLPSNSANKVPFTYSVSGNNLNFVLMGTTYPMTRVP